MLPFSVKTVQKLYRSATLIFSQLPRPRVLLYCIIYTILQCDLSVLVAHDCNPAIGGQGQSGCMRPVCRGSSSELRTNVRTMLKDAARLSWLGLEPGNRPFLAG